jgi:hypothetical protein
MTRACDDAERSDEEERLMTSVVTEEEWRS